MAKSIFEREPWVANGIDHEQCPVSIGGTCTVWYVRRGGMTRGEFRQEKDAVLFDKALGQDA